MVNVNKIASGLAADLLRTGEQTKDAKALIEDAFRRGLQLGLSARHCDAFRPHPTNQTDTREDATWPSTTH